MIPEVRKRVKDKQYNQRKNHPCKEKEDFEKGDSVLVRNYGVDGDKWFKGEVIEKLGSVNYKAKISDRVWLKGI